MRNLTFTVLVVLFLIITFSSQAQQPMKFNYTVSWKKVNEFSDKGLPESALKQVNEIYAAAQKDQNADQLVKSLIHILLYTQYKEEDETVKNLNRLEKEIKTATFPVKQVLHSMLAEAYWSYYQNNRYRYSNRSKTIEFKNDDIATWSIEKITDEVIKNYMFSATPSDKLKEIKTDYFPEVIEKGNKMGRSFRPTLFDFLAHRAIDFFKGTEPEVTKPAYAFTINSPDYLKEAETFINLPIITKDTLAHKYFALKLLQEVIRFHLTDATPDALLDADLSRLNFVYQNLTLPNKESLYLSSLESLEKKYIQNQVSSLVSIEIAKIWGNRGEKYNPRQSSEHKWERKKAYDICQEIINRHPNSNGAAMAYNYQQELLYKNISATIEKVNVPEIPFRALVEYKNISNLFYKAIRVTRKEVRDVRIKLQNNYDVDRENKFLEHFLAKSPATSGSFKLPADNDMQQHSVEININPLPVGDYLVIFSSKESFSPGKDGITYAFTTVSNISYLTRNTSNGNTQLLVLNRTTGEPLANATIQVLFNYYNNKSSKYVLEKGKVFTSDEQGFALIPYHQFASNREYHQNFFFDVKWANDSISTRDIDGYEYENTGHIWQYPEPVLYTRIYTNFFLDRAIYRPGQTLYFKGLVYKTNGKKPEIQPNRMFTVTFYDVNSQVVATKSVTTNEYGTFNGTFTTPTSGLTGNMRLAINDDNTSSVYFSVEEYKRPKFEVSFEPVKGSYRLNDSIKATGKAIAYSGANIDGASVKYRVVRRASFPYWWWCWYGYYPNSPEVEITNGTTQTDASGSFKLTFNALPDESVNRKSDPVFYYTLHADVTDINGETHSSSTEVGVGYKSLLLSVNATDIDQANPDAANKKLNISSTNLSGSFQRALVNVKINRLDNPARAFRKRYWERPDTQALTQTQFYKLFPNDPYADENNALKWNKGEEVFQKNVNTEKEKNFTLPQVGSWKPGKYVIEISAIDSFGQPVKEIAYFDVTNSQKPAMDIPDVNLLTPLKTTCEPGEKAQIQLGSSEKITVLYELERDGSILETKRILINNTKEKFEIPISEEYRGNIALHYNFVKNNRVYSSTQTITVPYTNKQLDLEFETFRNKLQPGEQEQWKIRIKGKTADKALAEMVATLYDASLDEFRPNNWYANFYNSLYARLSWRSTYNFEMERAQITNSSWNEFPGKNVNSPSFDYLNWFGLHFYRSYIDDIVVYEMATMDGAPSVRSRRNGKSAPVMAKMELAESVVVADEMVMEDSADAESSISGFLSKEKKLMNEAPVKDKSKTDVSEVKVRKNFNETAFFYPNLETNENGEISINFTIPEALTRWKMLGFAHTRDLSSGSITNQLVTQKDLMVVPNAPRFFRENDQMIFAVKVTSLVDSAIKGTANIEFFDALTMQPVNNSLKLRNPLLPFEIKPKQSTNLEWSIEIPEGLQAISYRVIAKSGKFSDGEEMTLPVLTNRMLITETLPLPVRGQQSKTFKLDKLLNNTSTTLRNQRYTVEFTSNPAWYAIQALPYLMEYPYECTEQTFSRFYANSLASHIVNSSPKIKQVFDTWQNLQPDALLSNLEKNQELKTALLEETPWVLNAKNESERKRNVALLFDLNRMSNELEKALKKIKNNQGGNGGFSWFPGLPEDIYITQHIVAGMGHMDVLGVKTVRTESSTWEMLTKAVVYTDGEMNKRYQYLKAEAKKGRLNLSDNHLGYLDIHYLYGRSYFKDVELRNSYNEAFNYYISQAKKYWLQNGIYLQGMLALALNRNNDKITPQSIIKSLSERALHSEEMGMYWKFDYGYYWYQAPIETQALMIEVYDQVSKDPKAVDDLQTWLLKQKQTQDWKTTKATSEACYALLLRGTDKLTLGNQVSIKVGDKIIDPDTQPDIKTEAGTGYFKKSFTANEISADMGTIKVTKKTDGVAWGAVYWQYFEQLDKITPAETPLKLNKKLFVELNTDRGPVITPVTETTVLKPGDLIKVRIELRVDRTMEYIHMKDMRASAFEPVETLSTYKYHDGLWYYESPRDMATNFFIGWLPKGTYVFEYPLRVSQKGNFSNGVTTIQCMYAPEFASHSEGIRVKID